MTRTASNAAYKWATPTPGTTANAYDGLNRDSAIVTAGGYDARGNLTADGSRTFTYDVENRMLTAVSGGTTVMFAYDPIGRLTTTATPASTTFLYDSDRLSAEYSAVGAVLRRYVHGPGVDEPLVWYEGAGTTDRRWLHQDRQGSVIAWSNGSGAVSASTIYKYGPWGEPGDAWGAGSRFRYTGQIAIPEAKLYHYKARMYDPATGRFMQTDPIGYKDDLDLYAYVGGDPVNKNDPTGLETTCVDRPNGGQTCTVTGPSNVGGAIVASAAAAVWNTGVRVYEAVTGRSESRSRSEARSQSESATETRRAYPYVVRVQVQGTTVRENSIPIQGKSPIPARTVNLALSGLTVGLSKSERAALAPAFVEASQWVNSVAAGGGVGPIGSTSFGNGVNSKSELRVDVEVLSGEINIVP